MSMTTHRSTTSLILELLKASSLGMQIHRRPIGYTSQRREQLFALLMFSLTLTPTWLAASRLRGEIQFQYSSLKSTFQELNPEHSSSPEPASSSDDFILDTTPSNSALPKPVPELVPNVPELVPNAPPPDPPARRPHQPKPPPPPHAPSSRHIKSTNRGDSSHL